MTPQERSRHCQDLTVSDLLAVLEERCVALACGVITPDDNNEVSTHTYIFGNRCTLLGLATLVQQRALDSLLDSADSAEPPGDSHEDSD